MRFRASGNGRFLGKSRRGGRGDGVGRVEGGLRWWFDGLMGSDFEICLGWKGGIDSSVGLLVS